MNTFAKLVLGLFLLPALTNYAFGTEFDEEGLTHLHRAAGRGDIQKLKALLRTESPLLLDSKMGVSVLHKAVYSGCSEAVRIVLQNGGQALLNLQSPSNGNTPLHDALYFKGKDWSVLKVLLNYGANIRIKNRAGITQMEVATSLFRDSDALKLMSKSEEKFYPLSHSAFMGYVKKNDFENVKRLIETDHSIRLSDRDENGFTSLIWAAHEGFVEITEYFLEKGANPNQLDEWMRANAGHKAGFWGRVETLKLLIRYGLDIDARGGYNGYSALHDAVVRNYTETATVLLDAGASCFVEGHDGKTPRSIAQEKANHLVLNHKQCRET